MLRHVSSSAAAIVLVCVPSFVSAAIIFNGNVTDTSQILSASNSPYFPGGQTDVVGVNMHFGSLVAPGDTVQGIAFDNVFASLGPGPYPLSENGVAASLTFSMSLAGRERTQLLNATGPDDTVLETVANQKFYLNGGETVSLTISGLTPDTNALVQVIGGDSGGGWTGQFRVTSNGDLVGDWTTVTDQNTATASLFIFDTTIDATGTLVLDFNVFTGSFASLAGFIISEEVVPPVPEPSTFALLGLGMVGLTIKARRRRSATRSA